MIIGPSLGGVLVIWGVSTAYITTLVALLISVVLIFFVKTVHFVKKLDAVGIDTFFSGLRFVFARKIILGTISLDLFAVLLGGATALLPIFADEVLKTGPTGLGLLRAAPAVNTPQEMQGRVNAVNSLFIGTSNQLGQFESGTMAGLVGAVPATIIGGVGTLAVAVIWMYWLFPVLRNLKTYSTEEG
ncbi:hypothetical protein BGX30_014346 [Mortierella sp. GBA39]|nr:hypothetical protein BGX30_014346 [Mortierella sp. GBA39]